MEIAWNVQRAIDEHYVPIFKPSKVFVDKILVLVSIILFSPALNNRVLKKIKHLTNKR
ncbi:MAG: hypothetical protein ACJA2S_001583 [Cyclobacteriaceae bacterium]|jgi:hypothetical protein